MGRGRKKKNVEMETDGIMAILPEDLIHRILDCMPIRDAARTSILSSKWRYIWSGHPRLVLDMEFFKSMFRKIRDRKEAMESCVKAIDNIVYLHKGHVQDFSLYIPSVVDYNLNQEVFQWISYLSRKGGIKDLTITNGQYSPYQLPSDVFSCPQLEYLNLRYCELIMPKAFSGFRALTTLHLDQIEFTEGQYGKHGLSAPLLKHLTFTACYGIEHFKIHLTELDIFISTRSWNVELESFERSQNLTRFGILLGGRDLNKNHERKGNLIQFLQKLPKLQQLRFDGFAFELFDAVTIREQISTTFYLLTILDLVEFKFYKEDQMLCLQCLLKTCLNLTELYVWASPALGHTTNQSTSHLVTPEIGSRALNKLTTVAISSISGLTEELVFIEMLLNTTRKLERMTINCDETVDSNKRIGILAELLSFTRSSTTARVKYAKEPWKFYSRYPFL